MFSEGDFVAPNHPADEDGCEGVESHEGRINGPFALDDAGVEDHESWYRLQPDEGSRGHLPGIVAGVEPWWIGRHAVELMVRMERLRVAQ